jgi:hypothetical protein
MIWYLLGITAGELAQDLVRLQIIVGADVDHARLVLPSLRDTAQGPG